VVDLVDAVQHKGILTYYDIPIISLRNPFLPRALASADEVERLFVRNNGEKGSREGLDLRHVSQMSGSDVAEERD
jgi:hypothetical protein